MSPVVDHAPAATAPAAGAPPSLLHAKPSAALSFRGRIYDSVLDTIGATPLVRIDRFAEAQGIVGTHLLAKLEFFNPLSSVKDRLGAALVHAAEQDGRLAPGATIIEPTSGNTGIGLAFVAAAKGYRLILCMPDNASLERRKIIQYLGAEIVLTPDAERMSGAIRRAAELSAQIPESVVLQQFENPANPAIHVTTTAEEIWRDSGGAVDVFVAGVGTGGTITGVGQVLKQYKPQAQVVAVEPSHSATLSGGKAGPHKIQGIGSGHLSTFLDRGVIDEIVQVTDEDALHTARQLARSEGLAVGISAGAAVWAAVQLARRPAFHGKNIVVLIPDSAERYLSTELLDEDAQPGGVA